VERKASGSSNTETAFLVLGLVLLLMIESATQILDYDYEYEQECMERFLPDLAGNAFRREALAKLGLLSLSFASLLSLARCLLRVRTWICAAEENKSQAQNQKHEDGQSFHNNRNDNQPDQRGKLAER